MSGSNQAFLAKDCGTVNINISGEAQVKLHAGNQGAPAFQSKEEGWWEDSPQQTYSTVFTKGYHVARFAEKLNAYTSQNIQGNVLQQYKDLSQSENDLHPQMKTLFDLYRGEYVPQEGFSAQSQTKVGETLTFQECVKTTQKNMGKPFTIIGQPGSGKTVLMKRLARRLILERKEQKKHNKVSRWEKLRDLFRPNIEEIIFHINIRDIPNLENATLAQVLFSPSVIVGLTKLEAQYGLQAIIENKIKIIIFLDGLDQASWYPESKIKVGPWTKTNTASIFGNILAGHLLRDVPITISSREHSIACLPLDMRPEVITALVGFAEPDAKQVYCQIMGDEADKDWEEMRITNPGMMYMCLTPLFLIFYMITRKKDPDDPPDCASAVMIRIIQILLESAHMQNVAKVINKLKQMAFLGTKEQRVVFTNDDLQKVNINYEDISDVIIKVSGLNILGQNILEGMFRYFFAHQTLQEVLCAFYVVEMTRNNFEELVSTEFHKPYWSVVRSYACGILKNEHVKNKISDCILKQNEWEAKWEYLKKNLEYHLRSNLSPAQKLDVFMALKEANDLEILQTHAEILDFSNSALTLSMVNVLCSVMKHLEIVRSLSLANCAMDDVLLKVIGTRTKDFGVKINNFDVRGNLGWTDARLWKRIFENLTISNCFMEVPRNEQDESNIALVFQIAEAADANVEVLNLGKLSKVHLDIEQLRSLVAYEVDMEISQLWMKPDAITFDENIWRQIFRRLCFAVDHCFVDSPTGKDDMMVWIAATKAVNVESVKHVSMKSENDISLNVNSLYDLNLSELQCKMSKLHMKLDDKNFDLSTWQLIFQQMTAAVDECIIDCHNSSAGEVLADAAKAVDVDNVKVITLKCDDCKVKATISDVVRMTKPKFRCQINKLCIKPDVESFDARVWRQCFHHTDLHVRDLFVDPPRSKKGEIDIAVWKRAAKAANNGNLENIMLHSSKGSPMTINDVVLINKSRFRHEMEELHIEPDVESFDANVWRRAFRQLRLRVRRCLIHPPQSIEREIDIDVWKKAAEAAVTQTVEEVLLFSTEHRPLTIYDIWGLNISRFRQKISRVWIKAEGKLAIGDIWQQTFRELSFIVHECCIKYHDSSEAFLKAAKASDVDNVKSIYLKSTEEEVEINIDNIALLTKRKFRGEIRRLLVHEKELSTEDWKQVGIMTREFGVELSTHYSYASMLDIRSFAEGHGIVKFQKIKFTGISASILFFNPTLELTDSKHGKSLSADMPCVHLVQQPHAVGRLIRDCRFVQVQFYYMSVSSFDVSAFADGLNGFSIKHLVVTRPPHDFTDLTQLDVSDSTLIETVRQCNVQHLYYEGPIKEQTLEELKLHTEVTTIQLLAPNALLSGACRSDSNF